MWFDTKIVKIKLITNNKVILKAFKTLISTFKTIKCNL